MSGVLEAIGFIGTVLGIIGFAQDNLPGSSPNGATLRVKVGLDEFADQNKGGRISRIMGYDSNNMRIGDIHPSKDISSGDFADYTFDQQSGGTQTQYASFIGSDGAICVSWITLKNKDGGFDAAWTGDVGKACGHSWHWGRQRAGTIQETGEPYEPLCTWIDADHSNGLDTAAIKIDFAAFGPGVGDTSTRGAACSKTIFSGTAGEIDGVPQKKKRSMKGVQRREWMEKRLIVSSYPQNNATELCQDEMSFGPDAVGSDGYYCDMSTRELFPLCTSQDMEGCVKLDAQNNRITKKRSAAKRSVDLVFRSYGKLDMPVD